MKHKHKYIKTTKLTKRTCDSNWIEKLFDPYYLANIEKCKCGEWYYIVI